MLSFRACAAAALLVACGGENFTANPFVGGPDGGPPPAPAYDGSARGGAGGATSTGAVGGSSGGRPQGATGGVPSAVDAAGGAPGGSGGDAGAGGAEAGAGGAPGHPDAGVGGDPATGGTGGTSATGGAGAGGTTSTGAVGGAGATASGGASTGGTAGAGGASFGDCVQINDFQCGMEAQHWECEDYTAGPYNPGYRCNAWAGSTAGVWCCIPWDGGDVVKTCTATADCAPCAGGNTNPICCTYDIATAEPLSPRMCGCGLSTTCIVNVEAQ